MRARRPRRAALRRAAATARTSRPRTAAGSSTGSCRGGRSSSATPTPRRSRPCARRRSRGTSFGAATEAEVELAAEIVDAVPSVEKVRLVSSGTEAAMSALRLARAFTKRDRILKTAGGYHGHADALLASAGSGLATLGYPGVAGRADGSRGRHDRRPVQRPRRRGGGGRASHGEGIAAMIVEPVAANMGVVPPEPGYLETLRRLCDARGALLDLRRGDHRLPRRARRRAGALRRHART